MFHRSIQYGVGMAVATIVIVFAVSRLRSPRPVPDSNPVADQATDGPKSEPIAFRESEELSYSVAERPLASALESEIHEWCNEDVRQLEVIQRVAHNAAEVARMVEENDRIFRRQLVYRKDPVALAVQRSKASGEPIRQLILPGLDGQELVFEVEQANLSPSGQAGSFQGHLADWPDSMVTLAFKFGREAFSVSSPWDNLYLEAEPREPGQIIIKEIDPETYSTGPCGTPDFIENEYANTNPANQS